MCREEGSGNLFCSFHRVNSPRSRPAGPHLLTHSHFCASRALISSNIPIATRNIIKASSPRACHSRARLSAQPQPWRASMARMSACTALSTAASRRASRDAIFRVEVSRTWIVSTVGIVGIVGGGADSFIEGVVVVGASGRAVEEAMQGEEMTHGIRGFSCRAGDLAYFVCMLRHEV